MGAFNDDAVYIALARSLWQGTGYRDLYLAGAPVHQKYPPLLPLLLVPFQALAPGRLEWMTLVGLASAPLACLACWRWLEGEAAPVRAGVTLLLAANPVLAVHAGTVMTDVPFLLGLLVYLDQARRAGLAGPRSDPAPAGRVAVLAALLALLFYLRSVALVVGAATVAAMLARRWPLGRPALYAAMLLLLGAPFFLWQGYAGYQEDVTQHYGAAAPWSLAGAHLGFYALVLPLALWVDPARALPVLGGLAWLAAAATGAAGLAGLAAQGRRGDWGLEEFLLLLYGGLFLFWPYADVRFFLPLLPVFYLCVVRGLGLLARGKALPAVLAGLLAVELAGSAGAALHSRSGPTREGTPPARTWRWLDEHGADSDPVVTHRAALWLYTGRPVVLPPPPAGEEDTLDRLLRSGARQVLVVLPEGPLAADAPATAAILAAVQSRPDLFREVFRSPEESAAVYEVAGDSARFLRAHDLFVAGVQAAMGGRPEEAERSFRDTLALEPDYAPARFNLAVVLRQGGREAEARRELEELLRRRPGHARARALLEDPAPGGRSGDP